MKENIEKPMIIARQEFTDQIIESVNNCGLPLFVIEPILKDVYLEVKSMLQKQYEIEKVQYENILQENQIKESES